MTKHKLITCKQCNTNFMGNIQRLYCDECIKERAREHDRKRSRKRSEKKRKQLDENFKAVNPRGEQLLPKKFNEISPIKYQNYHNHFRMTWHEILGRYGKQEELKLVLMKLYKQFYEDTGWQGFDRFIPYTEISQKLLDSFDLDEFRKFAGVTYHRKSDEDLRENFLNMVHKIKRLPTTIAEFHENSKIHIQTYSERLNIHSNLVENIVKYYIDNPEIIRFYMMSREFSKEEGKKNQRESTKVLERCPIEMEKTGKEAIEIFLSEHGTLPNLKSFQYLTGMSTPIIKSKFGMGYREFVRYLGFSTDEFQWQLGKNTEQEVIDKVSSLLEKDYIPQKTFDWLKGTRGWALKCDAYFPDDNLVIEYDGEGHFEPVDWPGKGREWALENLKDTQKNDEIKNTLIPQHGIKLIRISCYDPYWDKDFLKFRLLEHGVKIPNSKVIHFK